MQLRLCDKGQIYGRYIQFTVAELEAARILTRAPESHQAHRGTVHMLAKMSHSWEARFASNLSA